MTPDPAAFEKLGVLFLGRVRDSDGLLLLDSRDLTTHAVCVGMTGSGKTGLCIDLVEEAALDGVPAIVIDPKGDLANLLLTFPQLRPEDFRPWIDDGEAARQGRSPDDQARATADAWRAGLASWGQDGARIEKLRRAAEFVVYTPGSSAGLPISLLGSLAPPLPAIGDDADAWRERVGGTASALLALAGIEADPLRSREHVLLARILDGAWREGRTLSLAGMIAAIRTPPFATVGVVDLESFYPEKDRFGLAMALNALVASPTFGAWTEGEPLEVPRLLTAADGRPRVCVISIAHLGDAERMFFVTLLLSEVLAWMRTQPGTSSLRALLYMDEVFGYLPPTANPPSKLPLLTLLKQGRAFGLGVVLATQNPVDLDYKALGNAGTWLIGRLQTERDKLRLLDGLEGASTRGFDRSRMDALLSSLPKRHFVLSSAHEDAPVVFESRWAMSYLAGPLTRPQIQALMRDRHAATQPPDAAPEPALANASSDRPVAPAGVTELFLAASPGDGALTYRSRLLARARTHHVAAALGVDAWRELAWLVDAPDSGDPAWSDGLLAAAPASSDGPLAGARFVAEGAPVTARLLAAWTKSLAQHVYASVPLAPWRSDELALTSMPGESEAAFRARLVHAARERRDAAADALRAKAAPRLERLNERLRKAEQRVEVQKGQANHQRTSAILSVGTTVLGALFGTRGGAVTRAATAARGFGRASQERGDVARAESDVQAIRDEIAGLEAEVAGEVGAATALPDPTSFALTRVAVPARKADIAVTLVIAWAPWRAGTDGLERPAWG